MTRSSGTGLLGLGVVLAVIGAILRFAVSVHTSGFNIHKIGDIMLVVGIIAFVAGLIVVGLGAKRRTTARTDIRETPLGEQRVEQRDDWGAGL